MTTITYVLAGNSLKRVTTGSWQATKGTLESLSPSPSIDYENLVPAPRIGIRKDSVKLVGDMLVRPYDYRGRR
jgi:hypothetical protein